MSNDNTTKDQKYFSWSRNEELQSVNMCADCYSEKCCHPKMTGVLAGTCFVSKMKKKLPKNEEKLKVLPSLRKLFEAKVCAVRACL